MVEQDQESKGLTVPGHEQKRWEALVLMTGYIAFTVGAKGSRT